MEGKKFGELTVINYRRGDKWLCQCSCSNFAVARGTALRTGLAKSCKDLEILSKESTNYRSMQDWIKRNKPRPELCERCKENPVAGLYRKRGLNNKKYRRSFDDYEWLCRRCQNFKFVKDRVTTTEDVVYEIRKLYARGAYTQEGLAVLFNLGKETISCIIYHEGIYSSKGVK